MRFKLTARNKARRRENHHQSLKFLIFLDYYKNLSFCGDVSRSTPLRLMAFAVMLLALTLATVRSVKSHRAPVASSPEHQMVLSEITIPVEIIEAGEAPAVLEVRVQP
ncbi:hypothetical protein [Haloferula sp.]|uniref:hypothetical protein n=1 Tax=Haloferula sp. TaxID=2497595 RepID=UPI00329A9D94